jgi:RimJ/RimL family protein N-acetyltransferase
MKNLPILKGHQVYIGQIPDNADFYEAYTSWLNSERVRFGIGEGDYSTEEVAEMLNNWRNDPDNLTFCIYDSASDQPIGDVCIRYGFEVYDNDCPETAIMIGEKFGHGNGYEAMRLLLNYAFNELNYPQINLSVYENNIPAVRLYEKLGFKKIRLQNDEINGRSEYVMMLTKEEWGKACT